MSYTVTAAENGRYIRIDVVGEITGEIASKYILDSHALGADLGISCYLVDAVEARNTERALDNYRFSRDGLDQIPGFDPHACVAILAAAGDRSHDFYIAAAQTAGTDITVFYDEAEAIAHLETRTDQPPS